VTDLEQEPEALDLPAPIPVDLSILASDEFTQRRALEAPTDTGNAFRYARLCGDKVRYLPDEQTWLVWDGTRLLRDQASAALHFTLDVCRDVQEHALHVPEEQRAEWRQWARTCESVARRKAVLDLAATLPDLVVRSGDLDTRPELLNTPSGTVNLETGELQPHDVNDLITHCTDVGFEPNAELWTPLLAEFQRTFVPDPVEWNHLTKLLGSFVRGGNPFRMWVIMHGGTTTGKSQLTETIGRMLGDYAVAVNTSVFRANMDDKPRPDLLRALTARFVYAAEGASTWELHSDHIKRMSGEEPLVARTMHSKVMIERVPDFTPLIVCNSVPRIKGTGDSGLKRRLRVVPMTYSVAAAEDPRKRELFMRDPETRQALLSQLVLGCRRAYLEGLNDTPQRWLEATAYAFGELNNVQDFVDYMTGNGRLRLDDPVTTHNIHCWKAEELYHSYSYWIDSLGSLEDKRSKLGHRQFNAELRDMGWESSKSSGTRWLGKINPNPNTLSI
jgi:putative DNA primase/helicase